MATVYTQQSKNVTKTWLLMFLFFAVIVTLGWFISYYYNNSAVLYFAIIFSIVMNIFSYWYSDKIVLSLAGAKPADYATYPELFHVVENLSITAGLPTPKIFIIQDASPNAFATGRDKNHAVVAVTTGLLQILNKTELEGVVAHELSHIGNRDILLSTVIVVLVGFVSILANMFIRGGFRGGNREKEGGNILAIVGLIFVILSPIFAKLIQLAISRKREFLADASGVLLTRYPEGLASALQKISSANIPMKKTSDAISHLYIASPLGLPVQAGGTGSPSQIKSQFDGVKKIAGLFSTHPPIEQRINAILNR